eukprot:Sspe_Gene.55276::Locus_30409_Transcript_1_1_Confidence_1.000_Length_2992::g.55276::m.55276
MVPLMGLLGVAALLLAVTPVSATGKTWECPDGFTAGSATTCYAVVASRTESGMGACLAIGALWGYWENFLDLKTMYVRLNITDRVGIGVQCHQGNKLTGCWMEALHTKVPWEWMRSGYGRGEPDWDPAHRFIGYREPSIGMGLMDGLNYNLQICARPMAVCESPVVYRASSVTMSSSVPTCPPSACTDGITERGTGCADGGCHSLRGSDQWLELAFDPPIINLDHVAITPDPVMYTFLDSFDILYRVANDTSYTLCARSQVLLLNNASTLTVPCKVVGEQVTHVRLFLGGVGREIYLREFSVLGCPPSTTPTATLPSETVTRTSTLRPILTPTIPDLPPDSLVVRMAPVVQSYFSPAYLHHYTPRGRELDSFDSPSEANSPLAKVQSSEEYQQHLRDEKSLSPAMLEVYDTDTFQHHLRQSYAGRATVNNVWRMCPTYVSERDVRERGVVYEVQLGWGELRDLTGVLDCGIKVESGALEGLQPELVHFVDQTQMWLRFRLGPVPAYRSAVNDDHVTFRVSSRATYITSAVVRSFEPCHTTIVPYQTSLADVLSAMYPVVGIVGLMSSSLAPMHLAQLALATDITCREENDKLPFLLHPTQATFLDTPLAGAVVYNMALLVSGVGVTWCLGLVVKSLATRLPSIALVGYTALYTGTVYASLALIMSSHPASVRLLGVVGVAQGVAIPSLLYRFVKRNIPSKAILPIPTLKDPSRRRIIVGDGEWAPCDGGLWLHRFGFLVSSYHEHMATFLTAECAVSGCLALISALPTPSMGWCGNHKAMISVLYLGLLTYINCCSPYRRCRDNAVEVLQYSLQFLSCLVLAVAQHSNDTTHSSFTLGAVLAILAALTIASKAVLDITAHFMLRLSSSPHASSGNSQLDETPLLLQYKHDRGGATLPMNSPAHYNYNPLAGTRTVECMSNETTPEATPSDKHGSACHAMGASVTQLWSEGPSLTPSSGDGGDFLV